MREFIFLKKMLPIMAIGMFFGIGFNAFAQTLTPLQARLAQKNNLGKDTVQIGGNNGTWYVINKETVGGIEYTFLISYRHLNSQNTVEFCPMGSYNMDYATSTLRTEMNGEYSYIPNQLKDIAVVTTFGNDVNSTNSVSAPTAEMAGRSPSNSKYVLFAPSYKEVSDWNVSLGCSPTSFCPEIKNYYWSSHVPNGRWWTRSTSSTKDHKYEVNPGGGTFVAIPVQGSKVCMVGAIWVQSGVPYAGDYIITYKANNGTAEPDYLQAENSTNVNVTITTATQTAAGFTSPTDAVFLGWNTKADGSGTAIAAGATMLIHSDTTLYAQWHYSYTLYGTIFPFVHKTEEDFDTLFHVTARLYAVSQIEGKMNILFALKKTTPLKESEVGFYDGSVFVPTTPLHPGEIGSINNPGLPINWEHLGNQNTRSLSATVTPENNFPDRPVGIYAFENVDEGDYILTLSAPGFVTRYAKIMVDNSNSLGHRELIPGDFNNDGIIDQRDAAVDNAMMALYPHHKYKIKYDVDTDKAVDEEDVKLVTEIYLGFVILLYEETWDWLMGE